MKALVAIIASITVLVYPFLIYSGIQDLSPAVFASGLVVLGLAKLSFAPGKIITPQNYVLVVMIILSAIAAIANSEALLRLYPVGMSLGVGIIFFLSIKEDESLIEKLARLSGKVITPRAKIYTRKLTAIWAGALVFNSVVALYLALFSTLKIWAFYCGFLAYLLFAALFGAEFIYRQYYIKKHGA